MPLFILLSTLSQQGIQTLKSNPERLKQVNQDVAEFGCKVLHQWATLGEFDFVNVVEAPDIATVAKVSVSLGARGSTRIETLPALEVKDFLRTLELPDRPVVRRPPRLYNSALCAIHGSTTTRGSSSTGRSACSRD